LHLFFLRHGKAEDWYPGITDADRQLTPEGIAEMRQEALAFADLNPRIERIYTSPYPRALETARLVAEALALPSEQFHIVPEMAAGGFRMGVLQTLTANLPPSARVLFVGHEPDLSSVAGQLVGGTQIELKKGGLIYIESIRPQPGDGVLRWLLSPRHLTRLADE
jgi:phosphohistidine phosphatase